MTTVRAGDNAPLFQTATADGDAWSLADHLGKPVVLYFYPKDETPGCTAQACDVRDNWGAFAELGAEVVGISPDDEASHRAFRANHDLPQTLLVDPDHAVLSSYGAWGLKMKNGKQTEGVIRSSVVIGPDGTVIAVFSPIDPDQQALLTLGVLRSASRTLQTTGTMSPPAPRPRRETACRRAGQGRLSRCHAVGARSAARTGAGIALDRRPAHGRRDA